MGEEITFWGLLACYHPVDIVACVVGGCRLSREELICSGARVTRGYF